MRTRSLLPLGAVAVVALALTGCAGDAGTADSADSGATSAAGCAGTGIETTASTELAELLPASVADAGTLQIGTDPTLPPYEFTDENDELAGLDIELGYLIGCKLGLDVEYSTIDFAGLLTAVQAGRYDLAIAGISDTPERAEVLDLVDYQTEGTAIIVPKGNPDGVETIDDLCGLSVAAVQGSVPLELLTRKNETCADPIQLLPLPSSSDGFLAVRSGRADASMETLGSAIYYQQSEEHGGDLEALTTELYAQGYQAIAFPKDEESVQLRDAVQAALTELVEDGAYAELYEKWGLEANMVDTITVNDSQRFADKYYNVG
jgi:polar amino acid transport system substrate-binding protein